MDAAASSNAALMRRIVQLENERDDLRRDVEALCMQQSGQGIGVDLFSRLQNRRVSGLEQELESCRQKLLVYKRENENLQEELSEAYHIKGQFADLYKVEAEKNRSGEQGIKFFQSQVASLLSERDRLLMDAEESRRREEALRDELNTSNSRCEEYMHANEENLVQMDKLTASLEQLKSRVEVYLQVIQRFWSVRHRGSERRENKGVQDMASFLLTDPEDRWSYGSSGLQEKCQSLEASNATLQDELSSLKEEVSKTQLLLDEANKAKEEALCEAERVKQEALDEANKAKEEALCEADRVKQEALDEANKVKEDELCEVHKAKKEALDEVNKVKQLVSDLQAKMAAFSAASTTQMQDLKLFVNQVRELFNNEVAALCQEIAARGKSTDDCRCEHLDMEAGNRDAFVQALQEKVSALLMLSQQEERHILEERAIGAYESQLGELNARLSQVTKEKVDALLEVAQLEYECQRLQDREKGLVRMLQNPNSSGGRLLPANWTKSAHSAAEGSAKSATKESSSSSYIRSWLSGYSNDASLDIAKSRVETTAMHERVASLRQLMKAANRLNTTLAKTLANHDKQEEEMKDDLVELNKVFEEAQRLKLALKCTLPLSWNGGSEKLDEGDDKSVLELVSTAGMSLIELLTMVAEIHRKRLI